MLRGEELALRGPRLVPRGAASLSVLVSPTREALLAPSGRLCGGREPIPADLPDVVGLF